MKFAVCLFMALGLLAVVGNVPVTSSKIISNKVASSLKNSNDDTEDHDAAEKRQEIKANLKKSKRQKELDKNKNHTAGYLASNSKARLR